LVEIKTREKFNRRHMVDIPGIKFSAQRRYREIGHLWMGTWELLILPQPSTGTPDSRMIINTKSIRK
jgi:hypothetical protein